MRTRSTSAAGWPDDWKMCSPGLKAARADIGAASNPADEALVTAEQE